MYRSCGGSEVLMLNNRKIRLMTRLAWYEKKEGKEDIKLSTYYKTDYVRLNILKTVLAVTFGYLLVLAMIVLYQSEYLIANAVNLDYKQIGMKVLGGYLVLMILYVVGAAIGYSFYYDKSRKKLSKYFRMLRRLRMIYQEEDGEADTISSREDS